MLAELKLPVFESEFMPRGKVFVCDPDPSPLSLRDLW